MNRQEYNELVTKIEQRYANRPAQLRRKALSYVFGSYAYLSVVLLISLILLLLLVALVIFKPNFATIKIGIFAGAACGALLYSILKGVWVKMHPPEGIPVSREQTPELFNLLDQLNQQVAPVKFNAVIVTGDFNAAVAQIPRLGIFGWYKSYLILGLPLLQSLSPDEFKAVLAHEFAHLSNRDGSHGSWIYRIRISWEQMIESLMASGGRGSFALMPFISWFWPRFNAHAFVLSRLQEYRADELGAKFAGKEAMGRALQRVELRGRWLEESVWPDIMNRVNHESEAPGHVYHLVANHAVQGISQDKSGAWMKQAYLRPTDHSDTHPSLLDRLKSLDVVPEGVLEGQYYPEPPPIEHTAASVYLGQSEAPMVDALSRHWHGQVGMVWKERHKQVQELRKQLGSEEEVTTAEDAWKWADAMLELEGDEAAWPWVDRVLEMNPQHVAALFVKGRYLLSRSDEAGVAFIEKATALDQSLGMPGLELLHAYYAGSGDHAKLQELTQRADKLDEFYDQAQKERQDVTKKDSVIPHQLSPETINKCSHVFADEKSVKSVYAARKLVNLMPEVPFHLLMVEHKLPPLTVSSQNSEEAVLNRLLQNLPVEGGYLILIRSKQPGWLKKRIASAPNSLIYTKP